MVAPMGLPRPVYRAPGILCAEIPCECRRLYELVQACYTLRPLQRPITDSVFNRTSSPSTFGGGRDEPFHGLGRGSATGSRARHGSYGARGFIGLRAGFSGAAWPA